MSAGVHFMKQPEGEGPRLMELHRIRLWGSLGSVIIISARKWTNNYIKHIMFKHTRKSLGVVYVCAASNHKFHHEKSGELNL